MKPGARWGQNNITSILTTKQVFTLCTINTSSKKFLKSKANNSRAQEKLWLKQYRQKFRPSEGRS